MSTIRITNVYEPLLAKQVHSLNDMIERMPILLSSDCICGIAVLLNSWLNDYEEKSLGSASNQKAKTS